MLSIFTAYIKNIVVLLIFSVFAEMILPESRFRGYINMVMGVVMIAVILKPMGNLINGQDWDFYNAVAIKEAEISNPQVISETSDSLVLKLYENNLAEKIENHLWDKNISVKNVTVKADADVSSETYGSITDVNVYVDSSKNSYIFGGDIDNEQNEQGIVSSITNHIPQIKRDAIKIQYE